jgi:TolB-like protein
MIGTRLGPYEIAALIGARGMGEVYRARDERIGRDVAIKVLPAELAADPDLLRRFEQEARAAGQLNHPNILALYDVGTHDGAPYLVTELLEGQSLRERLEGGPLPPRKVIELAVQVCSGLAAAHEKGIVHRDLKPENLFITGDSHVKILDFGVAKLIHPEAKVDPYAKTTASGPTTEAGTVLGTAAYMSPEQVRGQAVDHRSDIFSLGVVLYEMLSGAKPFHRDSAVETMNAVLKEEPPELTTLDPKVPTGLTRVVQHCLEKLPPDRFQSARDLAFALHAVLADTAGARATPGRARLNKRRVLALALVGMALVAAILGVLVVKLKPAGPRAGPAALTKVVVLPFENLGSPEDAYFAAGMAEEITSRLANVQGLGVISRTSAVGYDRKGKTIKQIGADLGVDYVLEGSVRWEHSQGHESRVRITPQLIRVADDTHVWSDRYERVLADVFAIQSEVAESAVKAMGVTLVPREEIALKEVSTNDLQAYDLYLRGNELFSAGEDRRYVEGALQMYQAAVDRDPRFAQALAGLARSHVSMYWYYYDRSPERLAKGKATAERAVELRPDLSEAHNALGWYFYQGLLD